MVREIDLIPIRLHKGEPTWEIIDELLEHIDSLAGVTPGEFYDAIDEAYIEGHQDGHQDGKEDGYNEGHNDGFEKGWICD